mmetsp:Transcript_18628/g.56254  ORF Transcript_18628/g.56254 Transcript_18628/m.56254 type:complete len:167 (+) Transcript_18628:423-923(+)
MIALSNAELADRQQARQVIQVDTMPTHQALDTTPGHQATTPRFTAATQTYNSPAFGVVLACSAPGDVLGSRGPLSAGTWQLPNWASRDVKHTTHAEHATASEAMDRRRRGDVDKSSCDMGQTGLGSRSCDHGTFGSRFGAAAGDAADFGTAADHHHHHVIRSRVGW